MKYSIQRSLISSCDVMIFSPSLEDMVHGFLLFLIVRELASKCASLYV